MTRQDAKDLLPIIQAFADGKTVEYLDDNNGWETVKESIGFFFKADKYRIKPEQKVRYMTPMEVIGFMTHANNMVVKNSKYGCTSLPYFNADYKVSEYEYNYIDAKGNITSEWKKFEVEE